MLKINVAKVTQFLARNGYTTSVWGRKGGMKLARDPGEISIGEVLRLAEVGSGLVECMRGGPVRCILAPMCGLAPILAEANQAFFQSLDRRTLADALPGKAEIQTVPGLVR